MKNAPKVLSTKQLQPGWAMLAQQENILLESIPFIEINKIIDKQLAEEIKQFSTKKLTVVFTSQNAVESVFAVATEAKLWQVFCISGKTKSALLKYIDEQQIVAIAANGAELAKKILHYSIRESVVFFCGNKRMPAIPDALKQAGIQFEEIVVYQTSETPVKLQEHFDGILFFSPSAVTSFFSVNKINEKVVLFSIGTTTEQAIRNFSDNEIITAQFPSEGEMIRNVIRYRFSN